MRMAGVIVAIIGAIMMLYFLTFTFGTVFDNIAFATSGAVIYGKPAWVTLALERFNLINVAGVAISIVMIVWGFMNAIRVGEYSREW